MTERPWARLGVSVGLASIALGLMHIPLAGVDRTAVLEPGARAENFSVGVLGILPVLNAFVIVEVATLLKARWRRLRVEGPAARAPLTRIAHGLALALAALQSYGVAVHLESAGGWNASAVPEPGWGFRLATMCTSVAATAFFIVIANAIGRYGVGNGYSILIALGVGLRLVRALGDAFERGREATVSALVAVAIVFFVFARLLPTRRGRAEPPSGDPYRTAPSASDAQPVVRPLPCGIVPLATSGQLLALGLQASLYFGDGQPNPRFVAGTAAFEAIGLTLLLALVALFSLLFHSPSRIAKLRARLLGPETSGSDSAAVQSRLVPQVMVAALVLVGAWWLQNWLLRTGAVGLTVLDAVLLAAIVLDVTHEMRARQTLENAVTVGSIHRVYAVDVALELLHRRDIPAQPRTLYHRSLLQFFAPYLPVEILVPKEDAKRAQKIVAKLGKAKRPRRARARA